jgi:hypothetical protein
MGFFSFVKKVFAGEEAGDEAELDAARARHGIKLTAQDKIEAGKHISEEQRFAENYDVWEDLKHFRSNFFMGNWVTHKFHPVGEDKVKKQLAELQQQRDEEAEKKEWEKWGKEKEKR